MTRPTLLGIGASEVASLAGLNPFATETDVWLEKVGLAGPRQDSPRMAAGRALERPILRLGGEQLGVTFRHNVQTRLHPRFGNRRARVPLFATPDGYARNRTLLAEVKLVGGHWSDWSDGPPDYTVTQARAQLACHPRAEAVVVMALLGSELRTTYVRRDAAIEAMLVDLVADWWQRHVVEGQTPDPSGPSDAWRVLRATLPDADRQERLATTDELRLGSELAIIRRQIAQLEDDADALQQVLAGAALDADIVGLGWTARWTRRASTSWKSVALDAGASAELVEAHTSRAPSFSIRSTKDAA